MFLKNEEGIALLSVLWGLLILSIISMTVLSLGTSNRAITTNSQAHQQAHYSLDAAVQDTLNRLSSRDAVRLIANGIQEYVYEIADKKISVKLVPEEGKIDLNTSDIIMISGLMSYHGLSDLQLIKLEEWIIEKRRSSGVFKSVSEITRFPDFPDQLFSCIEPYLTIYSESEVVDLLLATHEMYAYIKWADLNRFGGETWLNTDGSTTGKFIAGTNANKQRVRSFSGQVFSVIAQINVRADTVLQKLVRVRITGNARTPYWVYEDKSGFLHHIEQCEHV